MLTKPKTDFLSYFKQLVKISVMLTVYGIIQAVGESFAILRFALDNCWSMGLLQYLVYMGKTSYMGADKSLARPTSRFSLFDG